MNNRAIGERYEKIALSYLLSKGYKEVLSNYHCRFGEIDLIMLKNQAYIFVEVKYRRKSDCGRPYEFVDRRKKQHIMKTAIHYIQSEKLFDHSYRFDIIEVLDDEIHHYENAFTMDKKYWR